MNMMTTQWMEQAQSLSFDAIVQMAVAIAEQPRPMPPAWMIAPSFRGPEPTVAYSDTPGYPPAMASSEIQSYR
jgi:hypothetical protein